MRTDLSVVITERMFGFFGTVCLKRIGKLTEQRADFCSRNNANACCNFHWETAFKRWRGEIPGGTDAPPGTCLIYATRSKRSLVMILVHAATKSFTNFSALSSWA